MSSAEDYRLWRMEARPPKPDEEAAKKHGEEAKAAAIAEGADPATAAAVITPDDLALVARYESQFVIDCLHYLHDFTKIAAFYATLPSTDRLFLSELKDIQSSYTTKEPYKRLVNTPANAFNLQLALPAKMKLLHTLFAQLETTDQKELALLQSETTALETAKTESITTADRLVIDQIKRDWDDKTLQLTRILPFLLQIYESIFEGTEYGLDTEIPKYKFTTTTKIPNKMIMKFAIQKIREIEQTHPHPELYETIYYFWDVFDISTALAFIEYYLQSVSSSTYTIPQPDKIITVVEKSIDNMGNFNEWEEAPGNKKHYHVHTRTKAQPKSPMDYANNVLVAMTANPFRNYNPILSEIATEITTGKDGNLEVIKNAPATLPATLPPVVENKP